MAPSPAPHSSYCVPSCRSRYPHCAYTGTSGVNCEIWLRCSRLHSDETTGREARASSPRKPESDYKPPETHQSGGALQVRRSTPDQTHSRFLKYRKSGRRCLLQDADFLSWIDDELMASRMQTFSVQTKTPPWEDTQLRGPKPIPRMTSREQHLEKRTATIWEADEMLVAPACNGCVGSGRGLFN